MHRIVRVGFSCSCLTLLYFARVAAASDPVGVYAVIERVELEPNAAQPEQIKLYGWFALADRSNRLYQKPQHGWLCYSLHQAKAALCRSEWKDLEDVAGSGKCIAFGSRYSELGKVAKKKDGATPVEYPIASGLFAIRSDTKYEVISGLITIPLATAPTEDSIEAPGRITLKAVNPRGTEHQRAKCVFDIVELKSGTREKSEPIPSGERETNWSPAMQLKPGRYSWQVEAIDGDWKSRSAETEFLVVKASP